MSSEVERSQSSAVNLPCQITLWRVKGEENCLFHSIEHQLQLAGIPNPLNGNLHNREALVALAVSRVDEDSRFRLLMSDAVHLDLALLSGNVAHGANAALAAALQVNIIFYEACEGESVEINSIGRIGLETPGRFLT